MECTLAHKSSLELWSHMAETNAAPTCYDRTLKSKKGAVGVAAKDVDFWLNRGSFFTEPLHIAVGSPSERCRVLRCVSHIDRQLGNKGTVWGIAPKLATVSPAMCLAQFAGELPLAQLTELACALSGNYRFASKPEDVVTSAVPLTSLREMRAFLHAHQQIRGASKALRAIDLAIDHLGDHSLPVSLPAPQAWRLRPPQARCQPTDRAQVPRSAPCRPAQFLPGFILARQAAHRRIRQLQAPQHAEKDRA